MRRHVFLFLTAALAVSSSEAAAQVRLGARGGLNLAGVQAETGQSTSDQKLGLVGTLFVEGGLFGRFGWQVGAQYSQKGIHEEATVQGQRAESDWSIDYVEMPVLVQYLARAVGPVALVVYGGGAPSFEVGCESTLRLGSQTISAQCGEPFPGTTVGPQQVKSFDVTGIAGAGFTAILGSLQVTGEAFYGFGMIPFVDEEDSTEPDLKHRVYSLQLGFSIPLGGGGPPDLLDPL